MSTAKGSCEPKHVERVSLRKHEFPCTVASNSLSIYDLGHNQAILHNSHNFTPKTSCDVYEITVGGVGEWRRGLNDDDLKQYIEVGSLHEIILSQTADNQR
jgi:hypothetical protein